MTSGRASKDLRKHSRAVAQNVVSAVGGDIQAVFGNELRTRERVEALEGRWDSLGRELGAHGRVLYRPFWGRLKWLLLGR